jgi:two-component system chemotaxis response regulator CheY
MLIGNALKKAGFDVVGEAKSGQEAVDLYFRLKPDLVTMDVNMPGLDGKEAVRRIIHQDPAAKVLVITSISHDLIRQEVMRSGAYALLAKPFDAAELVQILKDILKGRDKTLV